MEDQLQVLKSVPLLASLGREWMKSLAEGSEFVAVKKGELVVRENDPGDALYAVVSGRLQAYTRLKSGRERVFATYGNNDCFGEMPLISGETHWASVRALNDSVLLKIPREIFGRLLTHDPQVAVQFSQRLAHRIKELRAERHRAKWSTIVSLYSALPGAGKTTLATNLVASLARETGEPVLLLDFSGRRGGLPLMKCPEDLSHNGQAFRELVVHTALGYDRLDLALVGDEKELNRIAPLFGSLVKTYDYMLVDLPNEASPSVLECLVQSDKVFVIARNREDYLDRTRLLLQDLAARGADVAPKAHVVLTAVEGTCAPIVDQAAGRVGQGISHLLRWVPQTELLESVDGLPYVLRQPMVPYSLGVRRMARELGNVLVGLALGTGGARGLAHIGVIRVLEQEAIGIDVLAGSSMGSLIGAAWAVGLSSAQMEEIALRIRSKRMFLKLLDPMFPGAGLVRGMRVVNFLRSIVDNLTFADTLVPLKIAASDINTLEEVVFEEGKLIDAIRASISIPGILRPMLRDGQTLIDGGITDPVPVSLLARSGVSKIIAVNTIPNTVEMKERHRHRAEREKRPEHPRGDGMQETGPVVETPTNIINVYMRSLHAMQSHIAEDACAKADVVIRPILADGAWYDFYHPERYIRCGEEAARAALPQLKQLVRT